MQPKRLNNIPYAPNRDFSGRESLLIRLRDFLNLEKNTTIKRVFPIALTGMGGVGKTQLALEYAYRYAQSYSVIWWVSSESPSTMAADYSNLVIGLDLPEKDLGDQKIQTRLAKKWLENNSDWLLIFDNAMYPQDLEEYLPKSGSGHVIITSRNPNWMNIANVLNVKEFTREESIEFLLKRTGQSDRKKAEDLAIELGDLPLALEQAGAYIEETAISMEDYLERFRKYKILILNRGKPSGYPGTIASTFNLSIEAARRETPASADLLTLCSFMDLEPIPISLFIEGSKHIIEPLATTITDRMELENAISALRKYSLIDYNAKDISVHSIVRLAMREMIDEADRNKWNEVATTLKKLHSSSDSVPNWDDDAIKDMQEDKLGRAAFARYLSARISQIPASPDAHEAYMIHLYGPWGAGKSSLLNFLSEELDDSGEWLVARYNAWQNQHVNPPWWSLMDGIFQSIKPKLSKEFRYWEYWWRISAGNMPYLIGIIILVCITIVLLYSQNYSETGNLTVIAKGVNNTSNITILPNAIHNNTINLAATNSEFKRLGEILAAITTVWGIIIAATRSLLLGSTKAAENYVRLANDPMVKIKMHFEDFAKKINPKNLIILIDDLDRCQSKRVVELLEEIQTLFREANVVIVVVADNRWLNACYEQIYNQFTSHVHQPGKPLGYLFLEKAFRFSTPIPGINKNLKKQFWCYLLQVKTTENYEEDFKKSAKEESSGARDESDLVHMSENIEKRSFAEQIAIREEAVIRLASPDIMERLEHSLLPYCELLEPNPRSMKRLVNTYSANRALAILSDVQIELHQLALWTIIQSRWPLLADYLEKNPESLEKLGQKDNLEIPEEMRVLFADKEVVNVINGGSFHIPLNCETIKKCIQIHG